MNRSAAHTALVRDILDALGTMPGVIAGDNPCGVARYPRRDDPMKQFAVRYGWPMSEGSPDLLVVVRGTLVALEAKTGGATTTKEQRACHEALRAAGVRVEVVRSVADARRAIEEVGR